MTRRRAGRRPRALILVEDLPVPFDRRVWTEAQTLRDAGWAVTVVCPRGEHAREWHARLAGIDIFRYPLPTTAAGLLNHAAEYAVAIPSTLLLSLLAVIARGGRFDIVHACNPPDFLFPVAWLFRRMGAGFVYDQHDLAPEAYVAQGGRRGGLIHRFLLRCERLTYRLADAVIATNETYRRFAVERGEVPADRVFVVRSSPDPRRIFPVTPERDWKSGREFLVAYLGTMGPQDGVELFVEAARAVLRRMRGRVRFVAVGGGNQLQALRELVDRYGLAEDVTFTGRIPDGELRDVLAAADVAVSPDPANGFNEYCTMNKTLEYMAMGVPVVAFDLEETRVSAGEAAVYARPNDTDDLARLIEDLLLAPQRRAEMSRTGRNRITGPLSWTASASNLLRAYDAAVAWRQRSTSRTPSVRSETRHRG